MTGLSPFQVLLESCDAMAVPLEDVDNLTVLVLASVMASPVLTWVVHGQMFVCKGPMLKIAGLRKENKRLGYWVRSRGADGVPKLCFDLSQDSW